MSEKTLNAMTVGDFKKGLKKYAFFLYQSKIKSEIIEEVFRKHSRAMHLRHAIYVNSACISAGQENFEAT